MKNKLQPIDLGDYSTIDMSTDGALAHLARLFIAQSEIEALSAACRVFSDEELGFVPKEHTNDHDRGTSFEQTDAEYTGVHQNIDSAPTGKTIGYALPGDTISWNNFSIEDFQF